MSMRRCSLAFAALAAVAALSMFSILPIAASPVDPGLYAVSSPKSEIKLAAFVIEAPKPAAESAKRLFVDRIERVPPAFMPQHIRAIEIASDERDANPAGFQRLRLEAG